MAGSERLSEELNSLVYVEPCEEQPSRYEMARYSTWRIYLYQELENYREEDMHNLITRPLLDVFPKLAKSREEQEYYSDLLTRAKYYRSTGRQDNISHFICRMLYCQDVYNHTKIVDFERTILSIKLAIRKAHCDKETAKNELFMKDLKAIAGALVGCPDHELNLRPEEWELLAQRCRKDQTVNSFARVPFEKGFSAIRKRRSLVRNGMVYMNSDMLVEVILTLYAKHLKDKLAKMVKPVREMLEADVEDQVNTFLRQTIESLNKASAPDTSSLVKGYKLNLAGVEAVWKTHYPPCMRNLTQKLKQNNHLRHGGRRQLILFLKGCGMQVDDMQQYFHGFYRHKMTTSEINGQMYGIKHTYGLLGQNKDCKPKLCRNIIMSDPPKKDEHHGCPFVHWNAKDLGSYLKQNYRVTEEQLAQILAETDSKHYQVACGRLFEASSVDADVKTVPEDIAKMLGKSPHDYFQAGIEMALWKDKIRSGHVLKSSRPEPRQESRQESRPESKINSGMDF